MAEIIDVTMQNFQQEVLQANVPVLVDFWAPWCQPCKAIAPVIEAISKEYQGKLKVVKINTDISQDIATNYHISGMPTLLMFKDGRVTDQLVGAVPKPRLLSFVSDHV